MSGGASQPSDCCREIPLPAATTSGRTAPKGDPEWEVGFSESGGVGWDCWREQPPTNNSDCSY